MKLPYKISACGKDFICVAFRNVSDNVSTVVSNEAVESVVALFSLVLYFFISFYALRSCLSVLWVVLIVYFIQYVEIPQVLIMYGI